MTMYRYAFAMGVYASLPHNLQLLDRDISGNILQDFRD